MPPESPRLAFWCAVTLALYKGFAGCLPAAAGAAALDVHMVRHALIIVVIHTLHRLAVNADIAGWMGYGTGEGTHAISLLCKALTAGLVAAAGVLSAHTDITLATQMFRVVNTVINATLQICHKSFLPFRTGYTVHP